MSVIVNSRLGKYLVEDILFLNVVRARDETTGVSVIIKIIDRGAANPKIVEATKREVLAIQACIHTGIPMIIECFEFEAKNKLKDLCIVFKDEKGISVDDKKNLQIAELGGRLPVLSVDQVTKLFFDLIGILDFIHQKNMAHR